MSDAELAASAEKLQVCCRVSPQHKTRIVDAMKASGHVAAMTGDGVNDAPALKRANIGVAMGITGTDVSKQTADMVLTDDNFASIVAAIEQGRIIYSNIRKFVYFLLACNVGEILIIFGAMLFGMPIPLRPVHLLWLNLVSDGAPALALGMEKGDTDIMKHPPRPPKEPVINRDMAIGIGVIALVDAVAILTVFYLGLQRYPGHLEAAQTLAFVTLCVSELVRAFTARSEYHSIFSIGLFSNRWMVWAVGASLLLVLMVVYVPFLQPFFDTVPLTAGRLADDGAVLLRLGDRRWSLLKLYFRSRSAKRPEQIPLEAAAGGNAMIKVLVPVDGSRNCEFAVRHVVRQFMNNTAMEIHLLNVQPPLTSYITRFLSRKNVRDYHHDEAEKALAAGAPDAGRLRRAVCGARRGGRARRGHHRGRAPPALRPHRDERGAQELAHAPGGELDHQPGARADLGAGGDHRGQQRVALGALRHPGRAGHPDRAAVRAAAD